MQAGWTQEEMAAELMQALAASAARVPHPSGPVIEEIRSRLLVELSSRPTSLSEAEGRRALALALAALFGRRR